MWSRLDVDRLHAPGVISDEYVQITIFALSKLFIDHLLPFIANLERYDIAYVYSLGHSLYTLMQCRGRLVGRKISSRFPTE